MAGTKLEKPHPIALFERALGGRGHVLDALAVDSTPEIQRFVRLLMDTDYDDLDLHELAEQAKISLTDLLRAYRNATLAKAQILAVNEIATRLPLLAADVMERALPQPILCPVCRGKTTMPNRNGGLLPCTVCKATGEVLRPASVQRQRLALEVAELIRPPRNGPALLQSITVNPSSPVAPGSLEHFQQAVTNLLYKRPVVIDVQAEPSTDDAGTPLEERGI